MTQLTIDPAAGFSFDVKKKMQAVPQSFDYDLALIFGVAGVTRKTGRYDIDTNAFINAQLKAGKPRPQYVAIGIKGSNIICVFDDPNFGPNNLPVTKNGMVSSKFKVSEIIRSQGCLIPEDEGDELRLYFKLHHMIDNMYRAEMLRTPKTLQ